MLYKIVFYIYNQKIKTKKNYAFRIDSTCLGNIKIALYSQLEMSLGAQDTNSERGIRLHAVSIATIATANCNTKLNCKILPNFQVDKKIKV